MDLYIIKLGGSVITDKKANKFSVQTAKLRRIAKEIKNARKKKKFKLIIVHGAGPFGHTMVKKYKINNGLKTKKHFEGFAKTHFMCSKLSRSVVEAFLNEGLDAVELSPLATITQKNKNLHSFNLLPIQTLLKNPETIPVMYGTMVPDTKLKGSVISGDLILPYLAKKLHAKKVFMGTDVKGIYTSDPNCTRKAELISSIDGTNISSVLLKVAGSTAVDVTGGMKNKLQKLRNMLIGVPTFIFDLNKKDNLYNLLIGNKIDCTEVRFK